MSVTILQPAQTFDLTTLARVQTELPQIRDTALDLLALTITEASAAISDYCHQVFAQETVQEDVPAYGDAFLQLTRTPVLRIQTILYDSDLVLDYSIEDAAQGLLFREQGWTHTAPVKWWLSPFTVARTEVSRFHVTYTAGYVLPGQDRRGSFSVRSQDQAFHDALGQFPTLPVGARIRAGGFAGGNNGVFGLVRGTASDLFVTGAALTDETAGSGQLLGLSTLPPALERACLETVKAWYLQRTQNPALRALRMGDTSMQWDAGGLADARSAGTLTVLGLPPRALALLAPYRRMA